MASSICIKPELVDKVKKLNLSEMTTQEREDALRGIVGDGAKEINNIYEKSLLLKNQGKSLDAFIKNIDGVSAEAKVKISQKIQENLARKNDVVKEKDLLSIAKDITDRKYKLNVSNKEVSKVLNLQKEIDNLKAPAKGTVDGSPQKLALGAKIVELSDNISKLKNPSTGNFGKDVLNQLINSKNKIANAQGVLGKTGQTISEVLKTIIGVPAKGIKAAWDISYMFRQGLKVLTADPTIWGKQVGGTMSIWKKILNKDVMEEAMKGFRADMVTRDIYETAMKSKLAIGVVEDFFPPTIAQEIPALGNVFKASDDAFTMFVQGSRLDLFEKYVNEYATKNGKQPSEDILKSMARYVNGLTGRGNLDKAEPMASWLNDLFFSARYQVANLKTFTDPFFSKTPEVRWIAAKNLAKHSAAIFASMTALAAITDVGFDPRASTFGKARIPGSNQWIDLTGGLGSYFTLLGKTKELMSSKPKYGKPNPTDMFTSFVKGKLAPVPGALRDYIDGKDYNGKKPTVGSTLESLFVPISLDNIKQNYQKKVPNDINALSVLFDAMGASASMPKSKKEGSYKSPLDIIKGK